MKALSFDPRAIGKSRQQPDWQDGLSADELCTFAGDVCNKQDGRSFARKKADIISYILNHGRICVEAGDPFADRLDHGDFFQKLRTEQVQQLIQDDPVLRATQPGVEAKLWEGIADFSHTAPDWERLFRIGFTGVLEELKQRKREYGHALSDSQKEFYDTAILVWESVLVYIRRLSSAVQSLPASDTKELCLMSLNGLLQHAPQSMAEAFEMIILIFYLQNDLEGTTLRSLGRLDHLLISYYKHDIESGEWSAEAMNQLIRSFLCRISSVPNIYNIPICIGGDGGINELSWLFCQLRDELTLYCPKYQIRINSEIPSDFLDMVLDHMRQGLNSYVLMNDDVTIRGMTKLGVQYEDALDYLPTGCYEPMVSGKDVCCSCAGTVNLAKVAELALNRGMDLNSGEVLGIDTGIPETYAEYIAALQEQTDFAIRRTEERILAFEHHFMELNPSPVFSSTMESCVHSGKDAYIGGAVYNESSINCIGLANMVDAILAVREQVYEEKIFSIVSLTDVLKKNWVEKEPERQHALHLRSKYGNGVEDADLLAAEIAHFCAARINGKPNARGGVFRMGLFSIDWGIPFGEKTAASPDGRRNGEPLSKNLCSVIGSDRNGNSALIRSVTEIDASEAINGSVLDLMIHPSAVQGSAGLKAMRAMMYVYFKRGGQGLHMNILDAETLKKAQQDPEHYASLQVRVCGWNAYFTDLSKVSQDQFIAQAEGQ